MGRKIQPRLGEVCKQQGEVCAALIPAPQVGIPLGLVELCHTLHAKLLWKAAAICTFDVTATLSAPRGESSQLN